MQEQRVLGIAGWSGAGKTTLLKMLLPLLVARGLRVATLKHAHHEFDVDVPGKDSWVHRRAGASEVIVSSARRWVQMHELGDAPEPSLADLLARFSPCDLVLVEGFKRERHPKLEVHRPVLGKPLLFPDDPHIRAVASDALLEGSHPPLVDLNDIGAVAGAVLAHAEPLDAVCARLRASSG
ncbi:MAG: molybdopterin-guanine dinucleotide biosynthesis protein B [Pseudomonadota bacterium]|nr:molybdopterin-guanine dinucleotide biosynthesis protein B [Pseudomonadota bacterium]